MKHVLALIALLATVGMLCGETFSPLAFRTNSPSFSLLNPNKMTMTNSMSFSSGVCSGGQGFYNSTYTNHILYRFNQKLKMNVDLNFVNQGTMTHNSGISFEGNGDNNSRILPDLQLEYNPSDNTSIRFEFRTSQTPYYYDSLRPW
jgi:hypothetical protein